VRVTDWVGDLVGDWAVVLWHCCAGTIIDNAFIVNQALDRNIPVSLLPGTAPFYDFNCVEQAFRCASVADACGYVAVLKRPVLPLHAATLSEDPTPQTFRWRCRAVRWMTVCTYESVRSTSCS
jgi:hypothetical protein